MGGEVAEKKTSEVISEHEVTVRVQNTEKQPELYVKAEFLEKYFKKQSEEEFGKPLTRQVFAEEFPDPLYTFYLLKKLPKGPHSLMGSPDLFNNFGYLRAVGVSEGLTIPIPFPIVEGMAKDLVVRAGEVIKYLYAMYADKFDVTLKIKMEERREVTTHTELGGS